MVVWLSDLKSQHAGMDEKNERAVWGMLLEVCKQHQAQYFYMAPKFPHNLPFNRQVGSRKLAIATDFITNFLSFNR